MPYKIQIPELHTLLATVPEEDSPKDKESFWSSLAWELMQLMKYGAQAREPQIVLNEVRKAGSQYIWEFFVNDLAVPVQNRYNFHGQNTSQWLYAGAIVLQNGDVSTHH